MFYYFGITEELSVLLLQIIVVSLSVNILLSIKSKFYYIYYFSIEREKLFKVVQ